MRTLRTIGVVSSAAALLLTANIAFAEDRPTTKGRQDANVELRMKSASTTENETNKENAKERVKAAREEVKARMEVEHEKVTKRLTDIQDKVKREMAEKIATQFGRLNDTWTDHFIDLLDRYDAVIQKIQARADIAASAGKDVTSVTAAIQSAKTAIATARAAVIAQAAKTYAVASSTIPTTATSTPSGQEKIMQNLRKSFQDLHTTLFKDLTTLRDGVMKDARQAVQNALQALGKVPEVDEDHATTTPASNQ